jgi:VWFA-related protein
MKETAEKEISSRRWRICKKAVVGSGVFLCSFALAVCTGVMAQQSPESPQANPPAIKAYANEVLVPVVVRDAQGNTVGGLQKGDFEVLDDGKTQAITGFTVVQRVGDVSAVNSSAVTTGDTKVTPRSPSPAQRFVVLLFDDLNSTSSDLVQAQKVASQVLAESLPASDVMAVLSTSGANSGLTRDRNKLQEAITNLKVKGVDQANDHDCPKWIYQGELIVNKNDEEALQSAMNDAIACGGLDSDPSLSGAATPIVEQAAQRAVVKGEQNYRTNLGCLKLILSKMGALPGQRLIILVSPGFLTQTAEAMTLKSRLIDVAAQASVTINAVDARGLYTTSLDAAGRSSSPTTSLTKEKYQQASASQGEAVMAELADDTGGTYFHNSNDLEGGLRRVVTGPQYLYLLAFSAAKVKPNGEYHNMKVKVSNGELKLQARRGYSAPKPEQSKK